MPSQVLDLHLSLYMCAVAFASVQQTLSNCLKYTYMYLDELDSHACRAIMTYLKRAIIIVLITFRKIKCIWSWREMMIVSSRIFLLPASSDDRWSRLVRRQVLPGFGSVADSCQALPSPHLWSIWSSDMICFTTLLNASAPSVDFPLIWILFLQFCFATWWVGQSATDVVPAGSDLRSANDRSSDLKRLLLCSLFSARVWFIRSFIHHILCNNFWHLPVVFFLRVVFA